MVNNAWAFTFLADCDWMLHFAQEEFRLVTWILTVLAVLTTFIFFRVKFREQSLRSDSPSLSTEAESLISSYKRAAGICVLLFALLALLSWFTWFDWHPSNVECAETETAGT